VYDVFREWMKPSNGATVDELVSARIKRYMANLLYPGTCHRSSDQTRTQSFTT
jgi:hypothetical protein